MTRSMRSSKSAAGSVPAQNAKAKESVVIIVRAVHIPNGRMMRQVPTILPYGRLVMRQISISSTLRMLG